MRIIGDLLIAGSFMAIDLRVAQSSWYVKDAMCRQCAHF